MAGISLNDFGLKNKINWPHGKVIFADVGFTEAILKLNVPFEKVQSKDMLIINDALNEKFEHIVFNVDNINDKSFMTLRDTGFSFIYGERFGMDGRILVRTYKPTGSAENEVVKHGGFYLNEWHEAFDEYNQFLRRLRN